MAIALDLSSITSELGKELSKVCVIKPSATQYNEDPDPVTCFATNRAENALYIPLGTWRNFLDSFPDRDYPQTNVQFKKGLYTLETDPKKTRDQDVVASLALEKLKSDHTTFLACFPGFGKCLDPDTPVLMFDGTKKMAKDICVGDRLMGDDSEARNVLSVCSGTDTMYEVSLGSGESFKVNEPHILTLFVQKNRLMTVRRRRNMFYVRYFDGRNVKKRAFEDREAAVKFADRIYTSTHYPSSIDISVLDYLKLPNSSKSVLKSGYASVDYPFSPTPIDAHKMGTFFSNPFEAYATSTQEQKFEFNQISLADPRVPLVYKINDRRTRMMFFNGVLEGAYKNSLGMIKIRDRDVLIIEHSGLAEDILDICRSLGYRSTLKTAGHKYELQFKIEDNHLVHTGFKIRRVGRGNYCGFEIDGNGRFLLGSHIVTHNTTMGNYFTSLLKLKTAVICHIDKVNEQWKHEYETYSTAKVQRVTGKTPLDPTADVYIFGVQKAASMPREDLIDIGLVIFDEAHIATTTAFTKSLLRFQPKYVIGLSATPKRPDGMHKLLEMYFGPKKGFIIREEVKDFTIYKVETPYKPTIKYNVFGGRPTLDWTELTNSLAYNEQRQDYIVSLVLQHPSRRIMILSDRQKECDSIYEKLKNLGEASVLKLTGERSVEVAVCEASECKTRPSFNFEGESRASRCAKHKDPGMIKIKGGNGKNVDTTRYRVLVAGMKKAGVGFDDPTLTMLILATDRKDVEQFEGRIRTTQNIIYDIVDDYQTLETHWRKRDAWYDKRGATVHVISLREQNPQVTTFKKSIPQRRFLPSNTSKE